MYQKLQCNLGKVTHRLQIPALWSGARSGSSEWHCVRMENQKTPVLRKIPFWLRSFRISKDASVSDDKEGRPASCQTKRFLRSYRRSLGSRKSEDQDDENNHESQDVTRASLMSIRKIWAEEAKAQAFCERSMSERKSKKPCSLRSKLLGSPSKIPISEKMQANQRGLQSSLNHCCYSPNKENLAPPSVAKCKSYGNQSSAGSSDGNLASEIVLSAARHAKKQKKLGKRAGYLENSSQQYRPPKNIHRIGTVTSSSQGARFPGTITSHDATKK